MRYLVLILPLLLATSAVFAQAPTAKYPIILVIPSEACQKMIKYHVKSGCPPLDDLKKYDTSNQKISGHFITTGDITYRTNPPVKNHYKFYNNTGTITVCVACEADYVNPDLFQRIIIEAPSFTYIDKYANSTGTFNSYSDRYMAGCDTATIAYSDALLNDTIKYMESNCTVTSYNLTKTNKISDHPWSYDNPYSSLRLSAYLKNIIPNHSTLPANHTNGGYGPSNCINVKCTYTDPYKKW